MSTTFAYIDSTGAPHEVPLIVSIDDLDLDGAEALEEVIGADLREINGFPLVKQLRAFVYASVRQVDPTATQRSIGKVRMGQLLAAFTAGVEAANAAAQPAPAVETGGRDVDFTGALVVSAAATDTDGSGGEEILSPTSAGSEA